MDQQPAHEVKSSQMTALHLQKAIGDKDLKKLKSLLSEGVDVNKTVSNRGHTPLLVAAQWNYGRSHYDVLECLLKSNADVNARDSQGDSALHYLAQQTNSGLLDCLDLLFKFNANVDAENEKKETPVFKTVRHGKAEVLRHLAELGANVNHCDRDGLTPLHWACLQCNENMIQCLVDYGADLNAKDSHRKTPTMNYIDNLKRKKMVNDYAYEAEKVMLRFLLDCSESFRYSPFKRGKCAEFVWRIMLEHIAKLQVLDLPVNSSLLRAIPRFREYTAYHEECTKELLKARDARFRNSWITFFNLLVDGERKLKNYAGNDELVESFEMTDCLEEFPIYGPLMKDNMKKGIEDRELFDKSAATLSFYCPIFNSTHLIIRGILDCLSVRDYKFFV